MKSLMILFAAAIFLNTYDPSPLKSLSFRQTDSLQADWDKNKDRILDEIAGKENLPADSVFQNLKYMGKMPAKRLLAVMEFGYAKSLGVKCGHCHNTNDFASDEKQSKLIARDMRAMNQKINQDLLKDISWDDEDNHFVNCTTCHRGQKKPALNLGD